MGDGLEGRLVILPVMVQRALLDVRLTRRQLMVYAVLFDGLDTHQHRFAKLAWLANRTGLREDVVSSALKRLVQLGYLERGPNEPGPRNRSRRTYRMPMSPYMDGSHTTTTQSAA